MPELMMEIRVTRQMPYGGVNPWVEIYKAEVKIENDDLLGIYAAAREWTCYTHKDRMSIFSEFTGDPDELTNFKAEVSVKEDGNEILNSGNGYWLMVEGHRRFVQKAAVAAEKSYHKKLQNFLRLTYGEI